uniref:Fe2OG dioxygenase domain-containing protein n=1 Tax=Heterosigma akashiwo TaxID=2829 RepID=A0A7S4DF11_HETAK
MSGYIQELPTAPSLKSIAETETEAGQFEVTVDIVQGLTKNAIEGKHTKEGIAALRRLGKLCSARNSFDFEWTSRHNWPAGSVVSKKQQLFPSEITVSFLKQVQIMEEQGLFSTNPDSVDGLPSLHMNLVSRGTPVFERDEEVEGRSTLKNNGLKVLFSIIQPYIYDILLPQVQGLMNSSDIVVDEIFLRRYGQDIAGGITRKGISAHYDVFSAVTSVIPMDDTSADGRNGLYTTTFSAERETSNHAALRQFFPLSRGDCVIHTWDVLHGVDIESGIDRTSLIIWFTTKSTLINSQSGESMISPWLSGRSDIDDNNVAQFVLASALESAVGDAAGTTNPKYKEANLTTFCSPEELYLKSASYRNTFALTRVGSLADDRQLSEEQLKQAACVLDRLGTDRFTCLEPLTPTLTRRFWFEGAVRGNPIAQLYLADEARLEGESTKNKDLLVLAATLFGLAAQQGSEDACDALASLLRDEMESTESHEAFMASGIFQIAQAALAEEISQP